VSSPIGVSLNASSSNRRDMPRLCQAMRLTIAPG
jgi:hypothetical protein